MWVGGGLCVCACACKIQKCDDKMQEYREKEPFFFFFFPPFLMLVRHKREVLFRGVCGCVSFTSRQPCRTALKNSIWCERVFTVLLSDAQPWPSCPEYTQQLCDTLARQPNSSVPVLLGWLGRDQSQSSSWTRRCALMMGLLCHGNKCSSVVVISFWGGKNTTEIQDNKRLNNTA